ncbi:MAG: hypothetical protein HY043_22790, partial [Verrucomicrobia bacterium]|nr:hypothetical protein [Verrucomicrobiota bacterium]
MAANVQIIIEAVDKARGALDQVTRGLNQITDGNKKLVQAQNDVSRSTQTLGAGMNFLSGALRSAAVQLAAFVSAGALVRIGLDALNGAARLKNFADQVSESVEWVAKLKFAASQNNVPFDQLAESLVHLQRAMAESSKTSSLAAAAFRIIEIGTADGNASALKLSQVIPQLSDKFKGFANDSNKAGLAVALFGRGNVELINTFSVGSDGLAAYGAQAEQLGLTTQKDAEAADTFNNKLDALKTRLEHIGLMVGLRFVEILQTQIDKFNDSKEVVDALNHSFDWLVTLVQQASEEFDKWEGALDSFKIIFEALNLVMKVFATALIVVLAELKRVMTVFATLIQASVQITKGEFAMAKEIIVGLGQEMRESVEQEVERIQKLWGFAEPRLKKLKELRESFAEAPETRGERLPGTFDTLSGENTPTPNVHDRTEEGILAKAQEVLLKRNQAQAEYQLKLVETEAQLKRGDITQTEADRRAIANAKVLVEVTDGYLKDLERIATIVGDKAVPKEIGDKVRQLAVPLQLERAKLAAQANERDPGSFRQGLINFNAGLQGLQDHARLVAATLNATLKPAIDGISDGIIGMIEGTKTWGQAFAQVGKLVIESLI